MSIVVRPSLVLALAAAVLPACARAPQPDAQATAPSTPSASASAPAASASAEPPAPATTAAAPAPAPEPEAPLEGLDFAAEARTLYRIAACGPAGDIPARFDAAVVAKHCADLEKAYDEYKKTWVDVAKPFLAQLRPKDLPTVVVYPFGGGDLTTAL